MNQERPQNERVKYTDPFWDHVEKTDNGGPLRCKFCKYTFSAISSISRIKYHLSGKSGHGSGVCRRVPADVQAAAYQAVQRNKEAIPPIGHTVPKLEPQRKEQEGRDPADIDEPGGSRVYQGLGGYLSDKERPQNKRVKYTDPFWDHVEKTDNGGPLRCKFCKYTFAASTSISRFIYHLSGESGKGISICGRVPADVQAAAYRAMQRNKEAIPPIGHTVPNVEPQRKAQEGRDLADVDEPGGSRVYQGPGGYLSDKERPQNKRVKYTDPFWDHVEKTDNGDRLRCKFCKYTFSAISSISRIKYHLSGKSGHGSGVCRRVPADVQAAAYQAMHKKRKAIPPIDHTVPSVEPQRIEQEGREPADMEMEDPIGSMGRVIDEDGGPRTSQGQGGYRSNMVDTENLTGSRTMEVGVHEEQGTDVSDGVVENLTDNFPSGRL